MLLAVIEIGVSGACRASRSTAEAESESARQTYSGARRFDMAKVSASVKAKLSGS